MITRRDVFAWIDKIARQEPKEDDEDVVDLNVTCERFVAAMELVYMHANAAKRGQAANRASVRL